MTKKRTAYALLPLTALALTAAAPRPAAPASVPAIAPILTTPEAIDTLTWARPQVARVTHVDLDLNVDFAAKRIAGTATLDVLAAKGAKEIVLDSDGLEIAKITDERGRPLRWTKGPHDDEKGEALTVALNGAKRIVIAYRSAPNAGALQWLPPELTAGKRHPFLFSQGQSINNRSWIPTQDSPGIRQSWTARIVAPDTLTPVMSAERVGPAEAVLPGKRAWRFRMDKPVSPYLIALAIGDLKFRNLGDRTGVWAEPATIDAAARELSDTERMVTAAERLYGRYRWGRYDMLVLPPSFPYGGMENPVMTFLTPTFITGDKANVGLVAHELAHSWSGNLVTNATWPDGWLNEGFTSYFENRIMEALYGRDRAVLEQDLDWDTLQRDIANAGGMNAPATRLRGAEGDSSGQLNYVKGAAFLRTIETIVGRARWDAYLTGYFNRFAFQPQTSAGFLADLRRHLIRGDRALEAKLQLDRWVYEPGLPDNAVHFRSAELAAVDRAVAAFDAGGPASAIRADAWSTQEWQRFLNNLSRKQSAARLAELNQRFRLNDSSNGYVRSAWLVLAIQNRWEPAIPSVEAFATSVGRGLLVTPLYRALMAEGDWGRPIARRIFDRARPTYHPVTAGQIERVLSR